MSVNLLTVQASQFATNIALLLQQKGSKLRNAVMIGNHKGKSAEVVDQIGSISMQPVTSRFQPMGRVDATLTARWVFPFDFDLPQLIDSFDKLRLVVDPESAYVQNAAFAAGRQMDTMLLAAAIGTSKTGETGATSTVLPSGQKIASTFGASAATGMSVAKLREAIRLMRAANIDLEAEEVWSALSAKAMDNLLGEAQVTSKDFNGEKPVLMDGKITRFMGINFIHTELNATASSERLIPVWCKSGLHLALWNDIETSISKRNDIQGEPWQAYVKMTIGATRVEEEKIVQIACAES